MPEKDLKPILFRVFESKGWGSAAADTLLRELDRAETDSLSEKIKAVLYLVVQRRYALEDVRYVLGLELPGPCRVSSMPIGVVHEAVPPPWSAQLERLGRTLLSRSGYYGVLQESLADMSFELATGAAATSRWTYSRLWLQGVWSCTFAVFIQWVMEAGQSLKGRFWKRVE